MDSRTEPTIDCTDDVLVDIVGPTWAEGEAGAIWLFRPDPQVFDLSDPLNPNPLWSGAAWKPGRLPAPGP